LKNKDFLIISGGQSGVDRAALDFALENGIPCEGWCPAGRHAEDGRIPDRYPLKESKTRDYSERTRLNIEDSDGILIIYLKEMDEGTRYTLKRANDMEKHVYIINENPGIKNIEFSDWLQENKIKRLNIAGPRESNAVGVYKFTLKLLLEIFR